MKKIMPLLCLGLVACAGNADTESVIDTPQSSAEATSSYKPDVQLPEQTNQTSQAESPVMRGSLPPNRTAEQAAHHSDEMTSASTYWLKNPAAGLYRENGSWLRVFSTNAPLNITEVKGDKARIGTQDEWIKVIDLTQTPPERTRPTLDGPIEGRPNNRVDPNEVFQGPRK